MAVEVYDRCEEVSKRGKPSESYWNGGVMAGYLRGFADVRIFPEDPGPEPLLDDFPPPAAPSGDPASGGWPEIFFPDPPCPSSALRERPWGEGKSKSADVQAPGRALSSRGVSTGSPSRMGFRESVEIPGEATVSASACRRSSDLAFRPPRGSRVGWEIEQAFRPDG